MEHILKYIYRCFTPAVHGARAGALLAMVPSSIQCHVWRIGRFERTIVEKVTLYANYVPNVLRHGVLRDPNHSLRIE